MIDAGSSGSRAYLYGWPSHSGDEHQLLKIRPIVSKKKFDGNKNENFKVTEGPLVKKVTPGLSRYLYFIFVTEILFRNVNLALQIQITQIKAKKFDSLTF